MSTYTPSLAEVAELAKEYNIIPICRDLPADLETPVSVYLKLCADESVKGQSFLLESVEKGVQLGRHSFIGVYPTMTATAYNDTVIIGDGNGQVMTTKTGDPLDVVKSLMAERKTAEAPGLPNFTGGTVGYMGYDMVRFMERLPETASRDLDVPDMVMLFCDNLIVFDHVRHRLTIVSNMHVGTDASEYALMASYQAAISQIERINALIQQPLVPPSTPPCANGIEWQSNFTQPDFEENVDKAKEYIAAGDIFQVVLSQRLSKDTEADPFTIYRALRMLNPSPYLYFLDFSGVAGIEGEPVRIIGSSPELHVKLEGGEAFLHPIAGTRWRGKTAEEDAELAADLLADEKERAEHVMLVDLGRNDLGRVCEYGTVKVPEMMVIEQYSHVMHIVSDVRGTVKPEHDAYSLLRATFPAGTVSGAPKVRAMEIIEELEGTRRGPYAGVVGYIANDGTMDTCITIRTMVMQGKTCYVQAGGGNVADSEPTYEYNETRNKARALSMAVEQAEQGL
ncbi:MAG: anthranilate synthase component I [Chloroflexota bacterium]